MVKSPHKSSAAGDFWGDFEVVFPVLALIDPSETLGIGPFEHINSIFFACGGPDLKFLLSLSELLLRSLNVSRNRGGSITSIPPDTHIQKEKMPEIP